MMRIFVIPKWSQGAHPVCLLNDDAVYCELIHVAQVYNLRKKKTNPNTTEKNIDKLFRIAGGSARRYPGPGSLTLPGPSLKRAGRSLSAAAWQHVPEFGGGKKLPT